ncbi:MAG: helix-turn-helix domain-containing protein [Candidatus Sulfotelmatobacter sp.]
MKSHSMRGAESLLRLLQYCAKQSLEHPDELLKEYQIAREVYGRGPDFDPQSDSCVRVQAGRLRLKLAEYYASEGTNDPVLLKLPKGGYHVVFEMRSVAADSHSGTSVERPNRSFAVPPFWRFALIGSLTSLLTMLAVVGSLLWGRKHNDPSVASAHELRTASTPLAEFWRPFTTDEEEPWVIYSNAAFVGRPESGMRYFNARKDSGSTIYDHYTGVGEVLAVHDLDEAFASLGRHIRVKRGSLFSLDDTRNANLVFIGSPSENLSLRDIPTSQEFVFQRATTGPRKGDLEIVNTHPKAGEAASYIASPSGSAMTEDYAVIVFVPGATSERVVLILAGTTTFGTQGAVEFVSTPDYVAKLLQQLPGSTTQMNPFEALLHVKIAKEVPVDTELVAVRSR